MADLELRLHRTFKWARAPYGPGEAPRFGGPPRPLVLEHTDTLQFKVADGDWRDVPVIEADRPPEPEKRDRFGRPC
jgi:hypothetical protein